MNFEVVLAGICAKHVDNLYNSWLTGENFTNFTPQDVYSSQEAGENS